jgi:lactate dehydrogenase-like 2-hydroxyacid dehydrogenase
VTTPLVVLPYPLPDWAIADVGDEFDLHLFEPGCAVCRSAQDMLTSGPQLVDRELIDELPALKYICCLGSGIEGVDVEYATRKGIALSNSAIVTAEDVADQMLAITLALCCQVPMLDEAVRDGEWPKPIRTSLRDRKGGIVGLGSIGRAVARRVAAFGPEIRWTGPHRKDTPFPYCPDLLELADWADILLVTARADSSNLGLINGPVFDRLGPTGIVANVSRGTIMDEDALIDALKAGRLGGTALDVFESEPTPASRWEGVPNTVLSPHVGGFTTGVRRGIQQLVLSNLRAFFSGGDIVGLVQPASERR